VLVLPVLLGGAGYDLRAQMHEPNAVGEQMLQAKIELPEAPSTLLSQQSTQKPNTPGQAPGAADAQSSAEAERKAEAEREVRQQEQQRIMTVVPNFNTVISGQGVRLSKGQKTELAIHATLDPFNVVGAFFFGGVSELNGSHRGYGWGPGGYVKRVAANYADTVDATMLAGAFYPIILHQDPRFFRKGQGTVKARIGHALLGAVICRGDNGKSQPNFSNVLGNFSSGLISNLYYPADDSGIKLSLVNSAIVTLEGSLGNLALEFSPDVEAWWRSRHKKVTPAQP
jgi:hypothetical protein